MSPRVPHRHQLRLRPGEARPRRCLPPLTAPCSPVPCWSTVPSGPAPPATT